MTTFVNNVKTAMLLGLLTAMFLVDGHILGGVNGLIFAGIFVAIMNFGAFFFSDKIAIAAMRGQEVDEQTAPDLVQMIGRLARNANLPMPRVYICPQDAPNAFATGRSPKHAAVAVTRGALRLLDYEELEGVMAHELAHVKNRDTLTSTIAATIAGVISYVGWFFMFGARSRDVHPLVAILFIILAPIAAALIQMAISRSREFVADADGARIAGTPHGLANALRKLESMAQRVPMEHEMPAQNHMFIVQPLNAGQAMTKLFSTHPPTADRIAKLESMNL